MTRAAARRRRMLLHPARSSALWVSVAFLLLSAPPASAQTDVSGACPRDRTPPAAFFDTTGSVHEHAVDCLVWYGIAEGVDTFTYAPAAPVRRDQMASFLARTVTGLRGQLPTPAAPPFADVAASIHRDAIAQLAAAGIITGTDSGAYEPDAPVRRGQMAALLIRTYEYLVDDDVTRLRDHFSDDDGTAHEDSINAAADLGLTVGSAGGQYRPGARVTRGQLASFLGRMLSATMDIVDGGRLQPYPIGTAVRLEDGWELRIIDTDDNARHEIADESEFNEPPATGHQFLLARVRVTYRGGGSARFDSGDRLRAVGESGIVYAGDRNWCGTIPDPLDVPETFPGGSVQGNVCWEIRSGDADSLVAFDADAEFPRRVYLDVSR